MKTKNYVNEFCNTVKTLHRRYPTHNLGRHLDAALSDYKSLFGVSDKELSYAMDKYMQTLEIDPIASDAEVDKLMRETDKIFSSGFSGLDEEEEEEY